MISEDEALGWYARFDIPQGMPMLPGMLSETRKRAMAEESELPKLIPAGKVAVALPVTRLSSVAYALKAGDHIDALASFMVIDLDQDFQTRLVNNYTVAVVGGGESGSVTFTEIKPGGRERNPVLGFPAIDQPSELQRPRLVAQLTVQNMEVLGVGDWLSQQEQTGAVATPTPSAQQPQATAAPVPVMIPDIITVLVDPQDALVLKFLRESGASIDLALRSAEDVAQTFTTESVTLQYMFTRFAITQPPKLEYGTEPRIPLVEETP
jgi:pilus assembly protein CpaB